MQGLTVANAEEAFDGEAFLKDANQVSAVKR
jgi:hypothetical protein